MMDRATKSFLSGINDQLHDDRVDTKTYEGISNIFTEKSDQEIDRKLKDGTLNYDEYRDKEIHKGKIDKDLKALLSDISTSMSITMENTLDLSNIGHVPEGKAELESLLDSATEKRKLVADAANRQLLEGNEEAYRGSLAERDKLDTAIQFYNEQLKTLK